MSVHFQVIPSQKHMNICIFKFNFYHDRLFLLLLELYINRIVQYIIFCFFYFCMFFVKITCYEYGMIWLSFLLLINIRVVFNLQLNNIASMSILHKSFCKNMFPFLLGYTRMSLGQLHHRVSVQYLKFSKMVVNVKIPTSNS